MEEGGLKVTLGGSRGSIGESQKERLGGVVLTCSRSTWEAEAGGPP